jgi:two-component system, chemotaxis family, protein-glutamate methylesterase/glutaminase
MSEVRVLVVDDSATMRGIIQAMLQADPDIKVVGQAAHPLEARQMIKDLNPDVLTLDIEMPNMNGLEFLEKIMRLRPMPVVMVSTLTQEGADLNIAALEMGAFDCVGKPMGGDTGYGFSDLAATVKAAASSRSLVKSDRTRSGPVVDYHPDGRVLAIGSSTGGVEALAELIAQFPENCPPTVITQHMPASFTASFAARLDKSCAPRVREAKDGDPVESGRVYIAPGGTHHLTIRGLSRRTCRLTTSEPVNGHRPSVDVLFRSVAETAGAAAVGVILTGMGRDGAEGLLAMKQAGASTIGQDEASSVVYGMPKAAHEIGAVDQQLPLSVIAQTALQSCRSSRREAS